MNRKDNHYLNNKIILGRTTTHRVDLLKEIIYTAIQAKRRLIQHQDYNQKNLLKN